MVLHSPKILTSEEKATTTIRSSSFTAALKALWGRGDKCQPRPLLVEYCSTVQLWMERGIDHLMGILDCGMRRVFGWPLALLVVNVPSVSIHPVKCSCEDGAELPSQFSPWV